MAEKFKKLNEARDLFEKDYLTRLLQSTAGNVSKAARIAGRWRPDIHRLCRKHGVDIAMIRRGCCDPDAVGERG